MNDEEKEPGCTICVIIPAFVSEDLNELCRAASLFLFKPFGGTSAISDLKGFHTTWFGAYRDYFALLESKYSEDDDEVSLDKLLMMDNMQYSTSASYKQQWESMEKPEFVTFRWVELIHQFDTALAVLGEFPNGMSDICWNCVRTDLPLKQCAGYKIAKYCSPNCQSEAWWHHKKTTVGRWACNEAS